MTASKGLNPISNNSYSIIQRDRLFTISNTAMQKYHLLYYLNNEINLASKFIGIFSFGINTKEN
jgi:hypothetical protein